MSYLSKLLLVIAAMWVSQLFMAFMQARRFQADLKGLRMQGTSAVGMGWQALSGRTCICCPHCR